MKNIAPETVDQLFQIIPNKPGQRIIHFSEGSHIITKKLSELTQRYQSTYALNCCKEACYDKAVSKYAELPHMNIVHFNLARPRYKIQGIEYDYLISTLDFAEKDKAEFLAKCYPIIRTGGNIIIFIPNSSYTQRDEWLAILEEQYYVSTNIIDDMFEAYDVIVSKRMHGWGN